MSEEKTVFQNIEYKNKAKAVPRPAKINDIDTNGSIYDNIITSVDNGTFDMTSLTSLTNVSQARDNIYNMLDVMGEDPIIAAALNIYTSDACEPNEEGKVVWAESDDPQTQGMVEHLLDAMNVDKNAFKWVHSLVKYGDLYLRLYRNSEYNLDPIDKDKEQLNEALIVKAYNKSDKYADYMEMHTNPAELFDLQKFGKSIGYVRSHINTRALPDSISNNYTNLFNYQFNQSDIDLYPATDFVHASLEDNSTRVTEEITIDNGGDGEDSKPVTYSVKRGQSILYNSFRIWRELSLLENSVLLNRITKSALVRIVNVEVGDMEKSDVRTLLARIKSMVEQKSALQTGNTFEDYTNPGPIENTIYVPKHGDVGSITIENLGGQVENDNLNDLKYFKNKIFASLGIPGSYLGESDTDGSLFNNGNSLALKSSQYAKAVKRIQNAFIQAITDAINLNLYNKGMYEYINNFTIKMQTPATQEEKDRKDNLTNTLNNIDSVMRLVGDNVEDQATKLEILKSLLSSAITDTEVISALQDQIDKLNETPAEETIESGEEDFGDLGGDLDLGGGDLGSLGDIGGEEIPSSGDHIEVPEEPPVENFYSGEGGELLNEEDNLPNFEELGISYVDVK